MIFASIHVLRNQNHNSATVPNTGYLAPGKTSFLYSALLPIHQFRPSSFQSDEPDDPGTEEPCRAGDRGDHRTSQVVSFFIGIFARKNGSRPPGERIPDVFFAFSVLIPPFERLPPMHVGLEYQVTAVLEYISPPDRRESRPKERLRDRSGSRDTPHRTPGSRTGCPDRQRRYLP